MLNNHNLQTNERCESINDNYQTEPRSSRIGNSYKSKSSTYCPLTKVETNQSNSFALGIVQLPHSSSPLRGLGSGYNLNHLRQKNNQELIRLSLHNFEKSFREILHSKSPRKDDENSNIRSNLFLYLFRDNFAGIWQWRYKERADRLNKLSISQELHEQADVGCRMTRLQNSSKWEIS